jgi:PAS domain S-box-containing protein
MKPANWESAIRELEDYQARLDKALATSLAEYEKVFAESPKGLWVHEIDLQKRIVKVNPEELRFLGYTAAQMLGRPAVQFIVMEETSERAIDQKLQGQKELRPFVRSFRRADGSAVPLILHDRHIKDKAGRILGLRTAMTEAKLGAEPAG